MLGKLSYVQTAYDLIETHAFLFSDIFMRLKAFRKSDVFIRKSFSWHLFRVLEHILELVVVVKICHRSLFWVTDLGTVLLEMTVMTNKVISWHCFFSHWHIKHQVIAEETCEIWMLLIAWKFICFECQAAFQKIIIKFILNLQSFYNNMKGYYSFKIPFSEYWKQVSFQTHDVWCVTHYFGHTYIVGVVHVLTFVEVLIKIWDNVLK